MASRSYVLSGKHGGGVMPRAKFAARGVPIRGRLTSAHFDVHYSLPCRRRRQEMEEKKQAEEEKEKKAENLRLALEVGHWYPFKTCCD